MKVKALKEYLNLYDEEKEVEIKLPSGNIWEFDTQMISSHLLTDQKRETCKLYIR